MPRTSLPVTAPRGRIDLKVIVMGHGGVGKTSFVQRYIHNDFKETMSTIGASFVLKKWQSFYLGIWDTAGQERFTKISSYYCRGAQAAVLVFDLTDLESFEALDRYRSFLKDADPNCLIVLVGTKLDLVQTSSDNHCNRSRQVTKEMAMEYAKSLNALYFETSAKDNINVSAVFDHIGNTFFADRLEPVETVKVDISSSSPCKDSSTRLCCMLQ